MQDLKNWQFKKQPALTYCTAEILFFIAYKYVHVRFIQ